MAKVRMGMVGGGQGAFIGAVHRMAAFLDGTIELVCGAFSSDPDNCLATGSSLGLQPSRCYATYQEMFTAELQLPESQRMEFVAIVTPNHLHFAVAKLAIESGFHVISDKPATFDLQEALTLQQVLNSAPVQYGLTHTYTGYPLVEEARYRVSDGQIGTITKVVVEYSQGWLAEGEDEAGKQAAWRLDPKRAGASCCVGDIGVHAANLVEYISGLEIEELCADMQPVVAGRLLDDDSTVLVRFNNGAKGVVMSSQISVGEENNLRIRIYGTKGSIDWSQQEPNTLWLRSNNQPTQQIRTGVGAMCDEAQAFIRTPAGHPEGYLEAFANLYVKFAKQVAKANRGEQVPANEQIAGIKAAVRGMAFIENAVAAGQSDTKWHNFKI